MSALGSRSPNEPLLFDLVLFRLFFVDADTTNPLSFTGNGINFDQGAVNFDILRGHTKGNRTKRDCGFKDLVNFSPEDAAMRAGHTHVADISGSAGKISVRLRFARGYAFRTRLKLAHPEIDP